MSLQGSDQQLLSWHKCPHIQEYPKRKPRLTEMSYVRMLNMSSHVFYLEYLYTMLYANSQTKYVTKLIFSFSAICPSRTKSIGRGKGKGFKEAYSLMEVNLLILICDYSLGHGKPPNFIFNN